MSSSGLPPPPVYLPWVPCPYCDPDGLGTTDAFERFERIGPIVRNVPPAFVLRYSRARG